MHVERAQSCPTLCDPVDCSPPGSSVHRILQARILERVAMPSSGGFSQPRDGTGASCVSGVAGRFFTTELSGKPVQVEDRGENCAEQAWRGMTSSEGKCYGGGGMSTPGA